MNDIRRTLRLLAVLALLPLSAGILAACSDDVVGENVVVVGESDVVEADEVETGEIEADEVEEPSVEEALEARQEGEPPAEADATVEPVGEPLVEGIDEQVEAQIEALGETVSLSGTIAEVLNERTFVLEPASDTEPLLVIAVGEGADSPDFAAGSSVTLRGAVVADFYIEDVEKVTGLDLDDELLTAYEGSPAFIAISGADSD